MRTAAILFALAASACGVIDGAGVPVSQPEFYAKNVKGYAATIAGLPPDIAYGWEVSVAGEVARWRECTAIDTCGNVERSRPVRELVALEHVAQTDVDGRKVDVVRLSLEPRPAYVVPNVRR